MKIGCVPNDTDRGRNVTSLNRTARRRHRSDQAGVYVLARCITAGQKRASGEPYLVHPIEVANILAEMRLDEVSVSTGLLHDVVEDTLVDLDTLRSYFGGEITQLVDGLTKIAQISNLPGKSSRPKTVRQEWFLAYGNGRSRSS
jgi:(p)ppGpp synthase/HD superfamily hydrolase